MDFLGFGGQKGPIRDFTACSIRCVYRAELILGRKLTDHLRKPVLRYELLKVRLRYLNVPWTTMDSDGTCENAQVSAASCKLVPLG